MSALGATPAAFLLLLWSSSKVSVVRADLPVHCIRPQVAGNWKFHLGPASKTRSTCGHATPDVDSKQPDLTKFFKDSETKTLDIKLENPLVARVGADKTGKWTMIYDEGISVQSKDYEFFTFSHFEKPTKPSVHGKKYFRSFCGRSEVGWYRETATGLFGCFKAEKANAAQQNLAFYHLSLLEEKKRAMRNSRNYKSATAKSKKATTGFLAAKKQTAEEDQVQTVRFEDDFRAEKVDHSEVVSSINAQQTTWTATKYSDEFLQQKMRQLQKRGRNKPTSEQHQASVSATATPSTKLAKAKGKSVAATLQKDQGPEQEDASQKILEDLPSNHSWDNVDGENYLEPILDQADCGSCYAVSSVHMLSARYRVQQKNAKLPGFSINFPLYCSDLNQGCQGGYPSLVSMWSKHVGLIPKECAGPYFTSDTITCKRMFEENSLLDVTPKNTASSSTALDTNTLRKASHRRAPSVLQLMSTKKNSKAGSTRRRSDSERKNSKFSQCVKKAEESHQVAKVHHWNYIGGYYGNCNVVGMMQDLYKFGPLAVALEPGMDFMYYRSGVYKSQPIKTDQPWVKVDHAVLLIGWGEEPASKETALAKKPARPQPFWTIQNSWGSSWGENGNIRIARGENESGVEFQAVAAYLEEGKAQPVLDYVFDSILNDEL
ncbi:unnamed protein product [Amoebophrya sp. A120]|nr:unnamed protein product [Amoebophrya sp. A120]|eukprot:GSA120T00006371001.1